MLNKHKISITIDVLIHSVYQEYFRSIQINEIDHLKS